MKKLILLILLSSLSFAQQTYDFSTRAVSGWPDWRLDEIPIDGTNGVPQIGTGYVFTLSQGIRLIGDPAYPYSGNRTWFTWDGVFASDVRAEFSFSGVYNIPGRLGMFLDGSYGCDNIDVAEVADQELYCVGSGKISACAGTGADTVYNAWPNNWPGPHERFTELLILDNDKFLGRAFLTPALNQGQKGNTLRLNVVNGTAYASLNGTVISHSVRSSPGEAAVWTYTAPRKWCIWPSEIVREFETYKVTAQ